MAVQSHVFVFTKNEKCCYHFSLFTLGNRQSCLTKKRPKILWWHCPFKLYGSRGKSSAFNQSINQSIQICRSVSNTIMILTFTCESGDFHGPMMQLQLTPWVHFPLRGRPHFGCTQLRCRCNPPHRAKFYFLSTPTYKFIGLHSTVHA